MHDDRELVEQRIARILRERLHPAVYGASTPLTVEVWHAPGEPPEVADGLAAEYRPADPAEVWGPAVGHQLVPPHRHGARRMGGAHRGGGRRPRLRHPGPGFSAEGLVHRPDGSAVKGLNPKNTWVRIADTGEGRRARRPLRRGRGQPGTIEGVGDPRSATCSTAGHEPLYRVRRIELAVFEREVWELVQDVEVASQLMHELVDGRPAALEPAARAGAGAGRHARPRGRHRHRRGRPGRARPRARLARARQRAPGHRGRPRPHRLGLAVAAARDRAQGRPHLRPTSPR